MDVEVDEEEDHLPPPLRLNNHQILDDEFQVFFYPFYTEL